MLSVIGSQLYQWDQRRQVKIDTKDLNINFTVHFCHKDDTTALVVEPVIIDGEVFANIPNILMQQSGNIRAYIVVDGDTIYGTYFYVLARPKPDDYIYEETQVLTIKSAVNQALEEARESGEFDGEPGYTPKKGIDYYTPEDKNEIIQEIENTLVADIDAALVNIIAEQESILAMQDELIAELDIREQLAEIIDLQESYIGGEAE